MTAGSSPCVTGPQFGALLVDRGFTNRHSRQLLPNHMGRIPHRYDYFEPRITAPFQQFAHVGQLYLGVFSGPVEGILMIVGIYIITGFYGKYCVRRCTPTLMLTS